MASIQDRLVEWGLDFTVMRETEGKKAAQNLPAIIDALASGELSPADRCAVADALSTYQSMTDNQVRSEPIIQATPKICSIILETLKQPDDAADAYQNSQGVQEVASKLANMLSTHAFFDPKFCKLGWGHVVSVLDQASDVSVRKATPLVSSGPGVSRLEALQALIRFAPQYGSGVSPPDNTLDALIKYVKKDHPLCQEASSAIQALASTNPAVLEGRMSVVFALIRAGVSAMSSVLSSNPSAYGKDPETFHANIDVLMEMDFMMACSTLYAISDKNGRVLVPYLDKLLTMLETGKANMMESMIVAMLNGVANSNPEAVYPLLDRICKAAAPFPASETSLVMLIGASGKAPDPAPEKVLIRLGELLVSGKELGPHTPPIVLNAMVNLFARLPGRMKILDPYMPAVMKYQSVAGAIVEKITDWHAGRSLEDTTNRLASLEERVNAMNDEFSKQCANFDEVSKMMDKKIAEVKDFVGEIVKKLPQPYKLTVVGGVRKTLVLHFRCANTGKDVTTETKAWNQWVKIGFGLIKLGKCAAVAAAGNPMALASGVDALKDIYGAYKTKDDQDFNSFITQPFLTSSEQDKLIEQLRDGGFFSVMTYDAQKGDWVLIQSLDEAGREKFASQEQAKEDTLGNIDHKKGKNFGLGSVSDIVRVAADAADLIGIQIDGVSAGDVMGKVDATVENVNFAKEVAKDVKESKKSSKEEKPKQKPRTTLQTPDVDPEGETESESNQPIQLRASPRGKRAPLKNGLFGGRTAQNERILELEARVEELERVVKALLERRD